MSGKNATRQSRSHLSDSVLEHPNMVSTSFENACPHSTTLPTTSKHVDFTIKPGNSSTSQQIITNSSACVWQAFSHTGIPDATKNILLASWRPNTKYKYELVLRKWIAFCNQKSLDLYTQTINNILIFLTEIFEKGNKYSSICNARSALANIVHIPGYNTLSQHALIKRFVTGVFNLRPPLPRYTHTWDTDLVIKFLATLPTIDMLTPKMLTLKLTILLLLLGGKRVSTIYLYNVEHINLTSSTCTFYLSGLEKHDHPGRTRRGIEYREYSNNPNLCVIQALHAYIKLRNKWWSQGGPTQLLITHVKPHQTASKETISRWAKDILTMAGVNTDIFTTHSTRGACTSKAYSAGVPIDIVLKHGAWSNENTCFKYYYRENVGTAGLSDYILPQIDM